MIAAALLPGSAGTSSVDEAVGGLTGVTGALARFINAIGEPGVAVATILETVVPPIPSEVVLPLAGFIAAQGGMNVVVAAVAATIGSLVGALALYWLGRAFGQDRAIRWMAHIPLVDREELEAAAAWFHRHGSISVFIGRLVPGVRSLVSIPAGAVHMGLVRFSLLTVAGSLLWNSLLVGAGYLLGTQFGRVAEYAEYIDYVVIGVFAILLLLFVRSRIRRARRHGDPSKAL